MKWRSASREKIVAHCCGEDMQLALKANNLTIYEEVSQVAEKANSINIHIAKQLLSGSHVKLRND